MHTPIYRVKNKATGPKVNMDPVCPLAVILMYLPGKRFCENYTSHN